MRRAKRLLAALARRIKERSLLRNALKGLLRPASPRRLFLPLSVEKLEERAVLTSFTNAYLPPTQFEFNDSGYLSAPAAGTPLEIALSYVDAHASEWGLSASDVDHPLVTDLYTDATSGITHVYLRQQVNGLEVDSADLNVAVTANGQVLSVGGGFVPGLSAALGWQGALTPEIAAADALKRAAARLELPLHTDPRVLSHEGGADQELTLAAPEVSLDDIPARLHYVPTADGQAVLAWQLVVRTPDGANWYDVSVPASSAGLNSYGDIVSISNWMDDASYNVIAPPNESPQDGGFAIQTSPEDPIASPFGWHDTNGAAGPEFTDTRGNNVDAHLDRNDDDIADPSPGRPSGGAGLDFSAFTQAPTQSPTILQNQQAAQVNLFYLNNLLHDVHYKYGFTETAGNFQVNNYGRGGLANDAVQADAQDGGGTNNANFSAPPDGFAPRMQMYLFTSTNPQRDGDLDDGIIIHEYGHGVSTRLTGGPSNSSALDALQSGGMGEGWSDFYSLMFLQRPTDTQNGGYGMGTYLLGQSQTGLGIRRYQYSYDMTVDPLTFNNFNGGFPNNEVHRAGEIWTSALWDLNWLLVNKYGFDANLATGYTGAGAGAAGNKLTLQLVMDAMKLQPANPSFVQARDAILAADNALTGGANALEIWTAFARRGLGQLASTANSNSDTITTSFVIPPNVLSLAVASTSPAVGSTIANVPLDYVTNFTAGVLSSSVQAADFQLDGQPANSFVINTPTQVTFHYNVAPFFSQGQHTMSLGAGSILRASDNSPLAAFSGQFRYDLLPLQVVSTNPPAGSVIATTPALTFDVNFNEPLAPGSLLSSELALSGIPGAAVGSTVSLVNGNTTARFTINGLASEGTLTVAIAAGAAADAFGNPNPAAFSANYTIDAGSLPFPLPLTGRQPLGSLVYDGTASGAIIPQSDIDAFTLSLDPGQTLTLVVTPAAPTLYGAVGNGTVNPGSLLTLNQATGAGTVVADPVTPGGVSGLAFDSSTGQLFASTTQGSGSTSKLIRIDPFTGALLATIGSILDGPGGAAISIGDLAIQPGTGTLYGIRANDDGAGNGGLLYTINKTTGVATFLGDTSAGEGGGIAFAPDGSLYQTAFDTLGGFPSLNMLDPVDGSRLSTLELTSYYDGLAIRPTDGVIFASAPSSGDDNTYIIDPATGAAILVGATGAGSASDLAFVSGLAPKVQLFDPLGVPVSLAVASANEAAVMQTVPVTQSGPYQIIVSSSGGMPGGYTLKAVLNAAVERENTPGGAANDAPAAAQNLDSSFLNLQTTLPSGQRAAVLGGNAPGVQTPVLTFDFESDLGGFVVDNAFPLGAAPGLWHLSTGRGFQSRHSATQSFYYGQGETPFGGGTYETGNLQNGGSIISPPMLVPSGAALSFNYVLQTEDLNPYDVASVEVSTDGFASFTTLATNHSNLPESGIWTASPRLDLSAFAGQTVQIRFSFDTIDGLDNFFEGWYVDDVQLLGPSTWNDYYSLTLAAGQSATIALENLTGGGANFVLEDAAGNRLATALAGPANVDRILADFKVPATGTYFIHVIGTDAATYNLVATKSASFDAEPNDSIAQAQLLQAALVGPDQNVLGYASAGGEADYYKVNLNAGATLQVSTQTPAGGVNQFVNALDPLIKLYQANGTLVASDDNSADGKNALLNFTNAGPAATYYLAVSSTTATPTFGEYVLRVTGNTIVLPPFQVTATDPPSGAKLQNTPALYTVDFNDAYLASTVQPADLVIDGLITATGVNFVDGDTVGFVLPPLSSGTHTLILGGGVIQDIQGTPLAPFSANFTIDATPPRVIASSWPDGTVFNPGSVNYQFTFDEPMNVNALSADDFSLHGLLRNLDYFPASFSFNAAGAVLSVGYSNLPEDNYALTLRSGNFTDAVGNPLDGEFGGSFPSGDGFAGGDFAIGFAVDVLTASLPTPLTPELPLGSLIYDGAATGVVSSPGDTDSFTISLDAGQTVSVLVEPSTSGLQPFVELHDPANNLLGSHTALFVNGQALIQTAPATTGGVYTIYVGGASGTTGLYSVQITLNADLEAEAHGFATDDTLATAQSIDGTALALAPGASRLAVHGAIGSAGFGLENFESGVLPSSLTTFSSNSFGRIRLTTPGGTGNNSAYALLMDSNSDANYALNEAVYTVNLAGVTQPTLSFTYFVSNDEPESLPAEFSDHFNGDGVSISDDGSRWWTVLNAPTNSVWATASIDLVAAANAAGMTLGPNFKIKFQQFDNYTYPTDGRAYDNIQIIVPDPQDNYQLALTAGDTVTVALKAVAGTVPAMTLHDAGGALLATGVTGAGNLDRRIENFTVPATGTYVIAVSGTSGTQYNVVVTRNAALDAESNDAFGAAQSLGNTAGVLGAVGGSSSSGGRLFIAPLSLPGIIAELNPATGAEINQFAAPETTSGGPDALAYDGNSLFFLNGFGTQQLWELNPDTGAVRDVDLLTEGSQLYDGLAAVGGKIYITDYGNSDIIEFDPVTDTVLRVLDIDVLNPGFSLIGGLSGITNPNALIATTNYGSTVAEIDLATGLFTRTFDTTSFDIYGAAVVDGQIFLGHSSFDQIDVYSRTGALERSLTAPYSASALGGDDAGASALPEDWYTINVTSTASTLRLQTSTPAGGGGEFVNNLNPRLELYSPANVLVASGSVLADGKNELIQYLPPAIGTYRVRVLAEGGTSGEYFLSKSFGPLTASLDITATSATKAEGNSGTTPFTFTIARSGNLSGVTTVNYAVTGATPNPANGADFGGSLPSGSVTFAAGVTIKTVTISVSGDMLIEPDEGFAVMLSDASGGAFINTAAATGTIINDDIGLAITATDASKAEGNLGSTPFTFTITRTGDTSSLTFLAYSVSGSGINPANAADFGGVLPSGNAVFLPGQTALPVTINVSGDSVLEPDEGFTITLFNPDGSATITTATATGTIFNDDSVLSIAALDATKLEGNSGSTPFVFNVTRTGFTNAATSVSYQVTGSGVNPATGPDFGGGFPAGSVNFASGETTRQVTINVSGDTAFEPDEGFVVTLASPSGGSTIGAASATGAILNDDLGLAIAATSATQAEGQSGNTPFTFTITRTGPTGVPLSVDYAVTGSGVNPANAADFGGAFPAGTATFASGDSTQVITINVSGDSVIEPDERFVVTLSNATAGATISTAAATGTILNDDSSLAIAATDASQPEGNSANTPFTFTITRSGDTSGPATVNYSVTGSGANPANSLDFAGALPAGTVTFAGGEVTKSLTISVSGDTLLEPDEGFTVTLSNPSGGATLGTQAAAGTILNDDSATVAFTLAASNAGEDAGPQTLTVTLIVAGGGAIQDAATFSVSAANLGSTSSADYTLGTTSVTFAPNSASGATHTVTITPASDTLVEGPQQVKLTLTKTGGLASVGALSDHTVTIVDADSASVAFQSASTTVIENAGPQAVTLALSTGPGNTLEAPAVFSISAVNGTADSTDYNQAAFPQTVTFAAGQGNNSAQTISFVPVSDALVEGSETATLNLALSAGPATMGVPASSLVTIIDTNSLGLSITSASISENGGATTGTVTRSSADLSQPLVITLGTSDTTEATVPLTVTIPANQPSATFNITAVDDALLDGTQPVTITVSASGFVTANQTLDVTDFETLTVTLLAGSISEKNGATTGTVTRSNTDLSLPLVVTLASTDTTEATVPLTVTISANQASATFAVTSVDDALLDGAQALNINASAAGYISGSAGLSVTDFEPPSLSAATYSLPENSPIGTSPGTVSVTSAGTVLDWSIIGGNSGGTFAIDSTGKITVANNTLLNFETNPIFTLTVQATDNDLPPQSGAATVTVTLTNVNESPTAVTLSNSTVAENAVAAVIGNLNAVDPDAGDAFSFTVNDSRFEVVSGQLKLKAGQSLNFETTPSVPLTITATDAGGLFKNQAVTVTVTNVNEPPAALALSNSAIPENSPGAVIGDLLVTDPDAGDTFSFVPSDLRFQVVGNQLKLKPAVALDFEATPALPLTVAVTDAGGLTPIFTLTVAVTNVNEAPSSLALAGNTVAENATAAVIGNLTTVDPDAGDTFTYTVNDARFEVLSGQLKLKAGQSLDFETAASVPLTITATDAGGLSKNQTFAVNVTNVNEAPSAVGLSSSAVAENSAGAAIGNLIATDPDAGDTHSFTVSDTRFEVLGHQLKLKTGQSLDFETASSIPLSVTATDAGGLSHSQSLTITVTNVNEAPTAVSLSGSSVAENAVAAVIGNVTVTDPDAGDTHGVTVSDNRFEVVGGQLKLKAGQSLDFEAAAAVPLTITATDSGGAPTGLSRSQTFTVTVTNVNEPPGIITLSAAQVAENSIAATIGNLAALDPDAGDSYTLAVDDNRFEIAAAQLKLKTGQSLDFEATPTVPVTITATDAGGLSKSQTFTVRVANVNEAPTAIALAPSIIAENALGAVIGDLAVTDPDAGDTTTLTVNDSRFEIAGGKLKLQAAESLDFEAAASVPLLLTATDAGGLSKTQTVTLTVTNVNEAPTAINLSNSAVAENAAAAVIGSLTALDPDAGDSLTLAVNDNRFEIAGSQLKLKPGQSLDFEAAASIPLTLTATDGGGLAKTQTVTLAVTNVNEAPTAVNLAGSTVAEHAAGAPIGGVTASDPDVGDTLTVVVDDPRFEIVTGQLKLKAGQSLDYNTAASVPLLLTATDVGGLAKSQSFTVTVTNVNDPPQVNSEATVTSEDTSLTISLNATDPDGDALNFDFPSPPVHGALTGTGPKLTYVPSADFSGDDSFTYRASDGTVTSGVATVTVSIASVNDPPTFTKGSNQSVPDSAGAKVLSAWATNLSPGPADEAATQTVTSFTMSGISNPGLFSVPPAVSADGKLTYTVKPNNRGTATITISANDSAGGNSAPQTFTIDVTKFHPWHSSGAKSLDVDSNGRIEPLDALTIINYLNSGATTTVLPTALLGNQGGPGFIDTSDSNTVEPLDALLVVNALNAGSGEGESAAALQLDWSDIINLLAIDAVEAKRKRTT